MQSVLIVVHLMVVVVLVVTVLLQRSEGGALGVGGASGFMTGRGQASALTRATAILAALFFATSMGLTILARFNQAPEVTFQSITPVEPEGGTAKEGEGKGSLLDPLRRMEDQAGTPPALPPGLTLPGQPQPAAPAAPQSLNLPPVKQPATPLVPLAPVQTGPTAPPPASIMVKPAPPQAAPGPFKAPPPTSAPPWSK
ncbi:MAG TPA: preprotein translocase subunit SecG [Methylocella sp.]|nr:preprotein translocase subunit SecG [Methylocella sp.]